VTTGSPKDRLKQIRLEYELSRLRKKLDATTRELDARTRELKAAERQIADLKQLIEVRKEPIPKDAPEISDYYES
jgi:predicted  nucleic acid-binding Zn-ribbon protein